MITTINVFQSKWGFHPCSREHYMKLKQVRYYLHINRMQLAAWERWSRKLPKNRVRWIFDGFYDKHALDISFTQWKAEPWAEPEGCPVNLSLIMTDYNNALPVPSADAVKGLVIPLESLDAMIEQCEGWLRRIGYDKR